MIALISFVKRLFSPSCKPDEIVRVKEQILKSKEKDIKQLRLVNQRFKVLIEHGEIELITKNVKGIIRELE